MLFHTMLVIGEMSAVIDLDIRLAPAAAVIDLTNLS